MKMMIKIYIRVLIVFTIFISISCNNQMPTAEDIELSSVFNDYMVLQRDMEIPIWGRAVPGGDVIVKFASQTKSTKVKSDGKWSLKLNPVEAGGPYAMEIIGKDTISFKDVLVGEVWLCSGQSNMEFSMRRAEIYDNEISKANYDNIRLITINKNVSDSPNFTFEGNWEICTPESVENFSAVAYFFGKKLHNELNVPIGLIHSSWGGTPAEAWTSKNALESDTILSTLIDKHNYKIKDYDKKIKIYNEQIKKIENEGISLPIYQIDTENKGVKNDWAEISFNDETWIDCNLPNTIENLEKKEVDGAVWFRKTINIPSDWENEDLILSLGSIDDFDITYFNGTEIGQTGKETPSYWSFPREYDIPAKLVKSGKAVVSIRIFDNYGVGGFTGTKHQLKLFMKKGIKSNSDFISLTENWKYKFEKYLDPLLILGPGRKTPKMPMGPNHPQTPTGLYNGMIAPVAPYTVKGAIWYQGEANTNDSYLYTNLLSTMINDWRELWKQEKFYFGIVQLANFMAVSDVPTESKWAELREAQTITSDNVDDCGLATIIDLGESNDIHPKNKKDVGLRLALWAQAQAYNQDIIYSGPKYNKHTIKDNKITLVFENIADGLVIDGNTLEGFSISGNYKNYVWAKTKIEGNKIIVWSDHVDSPVAVRYAWADNPKCNLYNSVGLPAIPFRTDNWK